MTKRTAHPKQPRMRKENKNIFNSLPIGKQSKQRILIIGLLITGWTVFYLLWRTVFYWRTFSSIEKEITSFFIPLVYGHLFYFFGFKWIYKKNYAYFALCSIAIWILAVLSEYFYVIPSILGHIHPFRPEDTEEVLQVVRRQTLVGIAIRDAVIFSLAGLSTLYYDAYRYRKLIKEDLQHIEEIQSLQYRTTQYMQHEHFTENALSFIADCAYNSSLQKDMENILYLYKYSFSHTVISSCPVKDELDFSRKLYQYYQSRYPELPIQFSVLGEEPSYNVLSLITEPIICNMFKHGITSSQGKMDIVFDFSNPSVFKLQCSNRSHLQAFFSNPASRGLSLLQQRLQNYYGENARLDFSVNYQHPEYRIVSVRLTIQV